MLSKITLALTISLVIVDVCLLLSFADRPAVDSPQGGMGNGLMDMYALGAAGILIVYLLLFFLLYFMKKFTATNVMCGILVMLHAGIGLLVVLLIS